jgi:eukaryotic-like serine/threonine-protein kinase
VLSRGLLTERTLSKSETPKPSSRVTAIRKTRSVLGLASRLSLSRGLMRRYVWVVPILALVVLIFTGTWLRSRIELALKAQLEGQLRALLDADVTALKLWLHAQEANAMAAAQEPSVRQAILELAQLDTDRKPNAAMLLQAPQQNQLKAGLKPWLEQLGYVGYVVLDRRPVFLASKAEVLVGQKATDENAAFAKWVLSGRATVTRPFPSTTLLEDEWGKLSVGVPTMFAAAPVRNDEGVVVAMIGLRIRPDKDFTRILNVARAGKSGETYAFDSNGVFLSQSRFEEQMKDIGLLADQPNSRSVLAVEIRDPGVDLTLGGQRSAQRRKDQPLTRMAADAVQGRSGVDVEGYRDYRGVESVAAWTWLPEYGFGVACELDKAEAFHPVIILRTAFWALFGLLSAAGASLLGLTLLARRLENRMRQAVIEAGQLGQYALQEKIGQGGMGMVYRGQHAMLRRPTAIKMLDPSRTTEMSIARFEREVQLTSQLNHPNTITIYDYGRTQEGVFYYAMEYIEGFSLQSLVERFGPLPDGRVIHILEQLCASLCEAHSLGLIHRDIKPANIMLAQRGGVYDFVKLLDFGLVKAVDSRQQRTLTVADSVTGTPLYMSPESIQNPDRADGRSDLYSLGAVAYYLLSGQVVFDADSLLEIIQQHLEARPPSLAERVGGPISPDLEQVVMGCLAKSPEKRPQTAKQLGETLAHCVPLNPWTTADAERWWKQHFSSDPLEQTVTLRQAVDGSATARPTDTG